MNIPFTDGKALYEMCENINIQCKGDGENSALCIDNEDVSVEIRMPEMDMLSSSVSAVMEVRKAMTALQRKIGENGGLVAEGRDMGTVVFPDAQLKIFLTASAEIRAERRYKQLKGKGISANLSAILADIQARDYRDTHRSVSPLVPADDAVILDTTLMSVGDVEQKVLELAKSRFLQLDGLS